MSVLFRSGALLLLAWNTVEDDGASSIAVSSPFPLSSAAEEPGRRVVLRSHSKLLGILNGSDVVIAISQIRSTDDDPPADSASKNH